MSKRPQTPPDPLREHERKLLGDLTTALERYQEVLDIDWYPMVQPLVSMAVKYGAATTPDQFILLETVYKDQLFKVVQHRAKFAAEDVKRALDAIAHTYGWQVVDIADEKPKKRRNASKGRP